MGCMAYFNTGTEFDVYQCIVTVVIIIITIVIIIIIAVR